MLLTDTNPLNIFNPNEFKLDKIDRVSRSYLKDVYKFIIILLPGDAFIQTVLKINANSNFVILDEAVRISPYGDQSHCVEDPLLRNFCFCKDLLKNNTIGERSSLNLNISNSVSEHFGLTRSQFVEEI